MVDVESKEADLWAENMKLKSEVEWLQDNSRGLRRILWLVTFSRGGSDSGGGKLRLGKSILEQYPGDSRSRLLSYNDLATGDLVIEAQTGQPPAKSTVPVQDVRDIVAALDVK